MLVILEYTENQMGQGIEGIECMLLVGNPQKLNGKKSILLPPPPQKKISNKYFVTNLQT